VFISVYQCLFVFNTMVFTVLFLFLCVLPADGGWGTDEGIDELMDCWINGWGLRIDPGAGHPMTR
jgi:hypothetical protein